jgi:hypothetical protein
MRTFLLSTLAILSLGLVHAEGCVPTTSDALWTSCYASDQCYYGAFDVCQPQCLFSYWLYEESNDIPGLQRGDEVHDDTCGGVIDSDTIVW